MTYSYQGPMENTAKAKKRREAVSPKKTMETCRAVKDMKAEKAIEYLDKVIKGEKHVPYTVHKKKTPHQKKGTPGGYPEKSARKVKETIQSALKNAEQEGLNTENMKIVHSAAKKTGSVRKPRGKLRSKSTNYTDIEIILKQKNT